MSSQDIQDRHYDLLSSTHVTVTKEKKAKKKKKKKSKCHGNTKLHHLKRKWRSQGVTEEKIQALIKKRQLYQSMELCTCDDDVEDHHPHELESKTTKRKRDDRSSQLSMADSIRSLSQLSLSQRSRKRQRTTSEESSSMVDNLSDVTTIDLKLEKFSKYLKMPRNLLLRSLQPQLNYRVKRKDEQNYLLQRLQLIDEHFCVDLIRYLYQSYWDLGSSVQMWPVSDIEE